MVKKLEWIEMAQLAVFSILFQSLSPSSFTPGRFGRVLCAVLHPLGDSPGEAGRIHAVPGPGVDGATGAKHDHGAVGMRERLPLFAA